MLSFGHGECREAPNTMPRLVLERLVFPALHCWRALVDAWVLGLSMLIDILPQSVPGILRRGGFRVV